MEKNLRYNAVIEKTYKAQDPFELNLIKGEIITNVIETANEGWYEGKLNGKVGLFHISCARILNISDEINTVILRDKSATANRRCKAVYSYTQNNDDELSLAVGDVIDFIEEVEEGWWRGRLKNKIGVFPSNFVEIMSDPSPVLAIKRGHNTPAQTKKNLSNSKENLVSAGVSDKDAPILPPKPVRELCQVSYAYDPANEDELELVVGDIITILSKDLPDKGWWKGELKGKIGVFPDNFVTITTEVPPPKDSHIHKPDRPPLSSKVSLINKSPSGNSTTNNSTNRKDSFGSKDSLNEPGIVVGNVAAHRLSLENRTITYDAAISEKPTRKSIETKAGPDIRKSFENLDEKKSIPPPVLGKKPVVPIKKSPTITSVTGNLFSGFKHKVKGESKPSSTPNTSYDNLDGLGHSKPTSHIADINEKGVTGDKIKKDDLDFDHVERGSVLQDMRAGRAKAPKRRLPTASANVIGDRSSYMTNGNDNSLYDVTITTTHHNEDESSKPKSREWEKHKAPWMDELKANQMKKTPPSAIDAKSPENQSNKPQDTTSSIDLESFKNSSSEMSKSFTSSYIPNKLTKSTTLADSSSSGNYEMRTSSIEVVKSSITDVNNKNFENMENNHYHPMVKSMSAIGGNVVTSSLDDAKISNIRPNNTLIDDSKSTANIRPISMNLRNRSISPTGRVIKSLTTVTPSEITTVPNISQESATTAITTIINSAVSTVTTTGGTTTSSNIVQTTALPVTNENVCSRVTDLEWRICKLEQLMQQQTITIDELVKTLRDEKDKVKFLKTELDKYAQCVTQV